MRTILLVSLLALTAGCWSPRYFEPRENNNGTGPNGDIAAVYQVKVDEGATATNGEVRIWCEGAKARYTDDDEEVIEMRVGFEVENNGVAPIELDVDAVQCEELLVRGVLQDPLAPLEVTGSGYASPGTTARVDFVFRPGVDAPRDIDAFSVRFQVRDDAGRAIGQVTPFAPRRRRANGGWGGSAFWGWGGGPAWGWGWGGYGYWGRGYRLGCW